MLHMSSPSHDCSKFSSGKWRHGREGRDEGRDTGEWRGRGNGWICFTVKSTSPLAQPKPPSKNPRLDNLVAAQGVFTLSAPSFRTARIQGVNATDEGEGDNCECY